MGPEVEPASEPAACAACGESLAAAKTVLLYGRRVTKKCRDRFALRRELAWIIDYLLILVLAFGGLVLVTAVAQITSDMGVRTGPKRREPNSLEVLLIEVAVCLVFTLRDSIHGVSPGKLLMGLQVVDRDTGSPFGARQSFKRNLIMFVPLALFVLPFLMRAGPRPGDGWARTRVIDRRRAGAPAYLGALAISGGWDLGSSKGWH